MNTAWTATPGFGPTWYEVWSNGTQTPVATLTADYPNDVIWATGDSLTIDQIIKYEIGGLFAGPLRSALLSLHFECKLTGLTQITATPTP